MVKLVFALLLPHQGHIVRVLLAQLRLRLVNELRLCGDWRQIKHLASFVRSAFNTPRQFQLAFAIADTDFLHIPWDVLLVAGLDALAEVGEGVLRRKRATVEQADL